MEDSDYWQFDLDRLSAVLSRSSRASGVTRIRILAPDGNLVLERTGKESSVEIISRKHQILYNNQLMGWVVVSLAIPDVQESWGSLGYLTVAHLVALTTQNYGTFVADQVAIEIGQMKEPDLWEYDVEKFTAILTDALRLEGILKVVILDKNGLVIGQKEKANNEYVTNVKGNIVFNNNVMGSVVVYLDFPAIRNVASAIQIGAFLLLLLSGALIYFLPVNAVRGLEMSLLRLNSELETKVTERTRQLSKSNEELIKELVERKRLEASLIEREKMSALGQLAAGVAHEINNPLGIILGFAQAAAKRIPESDPLALPVRSIEREAKRCKGLVRSLLTFSRRNQPMMESCDLNEVVSGILGVVEAQARLRSVEVVREFGILGPLLGDRSQLEQVVVNLCNNAMDAMPQGGKISVRTRSAYANGRPEAVLDVEDTGEGIPEEIRDKIFNPFFTTKEVGKGTGLGLSLVYEIVQKHKGTIQVRSEVGRGTTFVVRLPCGGGGPDPDRAGP